jgi:hypothetical protein
MLCEHGQENHNTRKHAQHSTAQHSTAQHSTAQHSTAQHDKAETRHTSHLVQHLGLLTTCVATTPPTSTAPFPHLGIAEPPGGRHGAAEQHHILAILHIYLALLASDAAGSLRVPLVLQEQRCTHTCKRRKGAVQQGLASLFANALVSDEW